MKFNSTIKCKKNFVLDLRYAEVPNTGLSRFSISLFSELVSSFNSDKYEIHILLPPASECSHLSNLYRLGNPNVIYTHWPFKRGILWKIPFLLFDWKLYKYLFKNNISLYITPYMDPPLLPGIDVASTIHDLSFIQLKYYFQSFSLLKRVVSYIRILLTLLSSKYIFTVSESTKTALRNNFGYLFPKSFLGDSGSMFLGFFIGWLLIFFTHPDNRNFHPVLAIWSLSIPAFDLLSVFTRRIIKNINPFKPDRRHIHHILLSAGFSDKKTLFIIIFMAIFNVFFGYYIYIFLGSFYSLISFFLMFILYMLISIYIGRYVN